MAISGSPWGVSSSPQGVSNRPRVVSNLPRGVTSSPQGVSSLFFVSRCSTSEEWEGRWLPWSPWTCPICSQCEQRYMCMYFIAFCLLSNPSPEHTTVYSVHLFSFRPQSNGSSSFVYPENSTLQWSPSQLTAQLALHCAKQEVL